MWERRASFGHQEASHFPQLKFIPRQPERPPPPPPPPRRTKSGWTNSGTAAADGCRGSRLFQPFPWVTDREGEEVEETFSTNAENAPPPKEDKADKPKKWRWSRSDGGSYNSLTLDPVGKKLKSILGRYLTSNDLSSNSRRASSCNNTLRPLSSSSSSSTAAAASAASCLCIVGKDSSQSPTGVEGGRNFFSDPDLLRSSNDQLEGEEDRRRKGFYDEGGVGIYEHNLASSSHNQRPLSPPLPLLPSSHRRASAAAPALSDGGGGGECDFAVDGKEKRGGWEESSGFGSFSDSSNAGGASYSPQGTLNYNHCQRKKKRRTRKRRTNTLSSPPSTLPATLPEPPAAAAPLDRPPSLYNNFNYPSSPPSHCYATLPLHHHQNRRRQSSSSAYFSTLSPHNTLSFKSGLSQETLLDEMVARAASEAPNKAGIPASVPVHGGVFPAFHKAYSLEPRDPHAFPKAQQQQQWWTQDKNVIVPNSKCSFQANAKGGDGLSVFESTKRTDAVIKSMRRAIRNINGILDLPANEGTVHYDKISVLPQPPTRPPPPPPLPRRSSSFRGGGGGCGSMGKGTSPKICTSNNIFVFPANQGSRASSAPPAHQKDPFGRYCLDPTEEIDVIYYYFGSAFLAGHLSAPSPPISPRLFIRRGEGKKQQLASYFLFSLAVLFVASRTSFSPAADCEI